ncbi:hypothetical protein DFP72DRAFT_907987 [Ephemerocybe angulata]|uniref:F-box domain-containing protein n=1 Tax=Ephemerocybe angulata TaxID=980116 RepID=A0A8H6HRV0_9AGAR|nr:hypothetical protein DFP72DRAFT_907987 [Tulosesus angulatus]
MSLSTLVPELVSRILINLNLNDVRALSSSCFRLRIASEPTLYKTIVISRHSLPLLSILLHKPQLAAYVRTVKFLVAPDSQAIQSCLSSLEVASLALAQMRGLVSLSISIPPQSSSTVLPIGSTAFFPDLRDLQLSFKLDSHLVEFLTRTPGLTCLKLDQAEDIPPQASLPPILLPNTLLPNLTSISGPVALVQALVPGRPVSSIFITSGNLTNAAVTQIGLSSAAISTLDAKISSAPIPIIQELVISAPHLTHLRLATTYDLWLDFFNVVFIDQVKTVLSGLGQLRTANIAGLIWKWSALHVLTHQPYPPFPARRDEDEDGLFSIHSQFYFY